MESPILYLMCGISRSGKTSWATEFCREVHGGAVIYLSSDGLRKVISGDENNQDCSAQVFKTLEIMVDFFLSSGQSCLVDALNYRPQNRKLFLDIARKYKVRTVAYCLNTSFNLCVRRNNNCERKVPLNVLQGQFNNLTWPTNEEMHKVEFV